MDELIASGYDENDKRQHRGGGLIADPQKRDEIFFINSNGRVNGQIYNFDITLPENLLEWDEESEVAYFDLQQFSTPYSWHNVNSTNNSFEYSDNGGSSYSTVTIQAGNYSCRQLASTLKTLLNSVANVIVWNLIYNVQTNKYTFSYTGTATGGVIFRKPSDDSKVFYLLGVDINSNTDSHLFSGSFMTSAYQQVNGAITNLYLYMSLSSGNIYYNETAKGVHVQCFASIPVNVYGFFGNVSWESKVNPSLFSAKMKKFGNVIHFSVSDGDGNYVMMTEDWNATFKFRVEPKEKELANVERLLAYGLEQDIKKIEREEIL